MKRKTIANLGLSFLVVTVVIGVVAVIITGISLLNRYLGNDTTFIITGFLFLWGLAFWIINTTK